MARNVTRVSTASAYQNTRRRPRYPVHEWQIAAKPYQLQPFMIAPVLAGETLKSALFQSRVVSDPVANPLIGWWKEYFFFYVKHRDLEERELLTEMMLNIDADLSSLNSAADPKYYHYGGTINWAKLCLRRVVEEYFRNEGEEWDQYMIDGLPVSSISKEKWMNSVIPAAEMTSFDLDVDQDGDGTITAGEISATMHMYEMLRTHGLTEMSYEDYLATHGVRPATVELHRPELLRNISVWSYPTNTINAENGDPSSALSWSIRERIDKDRFFKEPGFIIGIACCRPKVYFGGQKGSGVGMMNDALSWLPALMHDRPETSLKHFADQTGPLGDVADADGYWVDVRDLLMYGDQFINFDPATASDANLVALPQADLQRRYASATDVAGMFATERQTIREDGVINLVIHGRQQDHTPGTP